MTSLPNLSDIPLNQPDFPAMEDCYKELTEKARTGSIDDCMSALNQRERLVKSFTSWGGMAYLRFYQDTQDEKIKEQKDKVDQLQPQYQTLDADFTAEILNSRHRSDLEQRLGGRVFQIWQIDQEIQSEAVQEELAEESQIASEHTACLAEARIAFQGEEHGLSGMRAFGKHADRETRYAAQKATWTWFSENGERIHDIYDRVVKKRHVIAQKLGYGNFIPLGYRRMYRTDYGPKEIARFRDEIRNRIVPLVGKVQEVQAQKLGIPKVMSWDGQVYDLEGTPKPKGDHDWLMEQGQVLFDRFCPEMGEFFKMMRSRGLLDLKMRKGKGMGGFCTYLHEPEAPFIFANFNGTEADTIVFTHEIGHAFQIWNSRHITPSDLCWPSMEAAEVHSMSLEYLTLPHMELFFKEDAERFRWEKMAGAINFFPGLAAMDHFQHLVYEKPNATAKEREQMFQDIETLYHPSTDRGDLQPLFGGRGWHQVGHLFKAAFYTIDYNLALACALQLWQLSSQDKAQALERYVALCRRGGSRSFLGLVKSAGLRSPFEPGCLEDVSDLVVAELGLTA
jgi:M3 family oligoendopeptidase